MWQEILVFTILAVTGGLVLWRFYRNITGKSSCDGGGGCTGCGASRAKPAKGTELRMSPHSGGGSGGCCCHH
jgi:hypothetical protein